ncbi:hypothetical protein PoB_000873000 [Plakobranchus ocellatus]|uniref:Uncharacterized protein n=1 Tax=Plakobranchus ocellatus TaxID=259542 RepID=A0AAV3YI76_9GAST|nr:hypothetical protein PoB_000873000 [Plakobranchus ocellatus]
MHPEAERFEIIEVILVLVTTSQRHQIEVYELIFNNNELEFKHKKPIVMATGCISYRATWVQRKDCSSYLNVRPVSYRTSPAGAMQMLSSLLSFSQQQIKDKQQKVADPTIEVPTKQSNQVPILTSYSMRQIRATSFELPEASHDSVLKLSTCPDWLFSMLETSEGFS